MTRQGGLFSTKTYFSRLSFFLFELKRKKEFLYFLRNNLKRMIRMLISTLFLKFCEVLVQYFLSIIVGITVHSPFLPHSPFHVNIKPFRFPVEIC